MDENKSAKNLLSKEEWLAEHAFNPNPFLSEAMDANTDSLLEKNPEAIVALRYDNEIQGSETDPGPRFIFAGRGCGKTVYKKAIEKNHKGNLEKGIGNTLVVNLQDYDLLLKEAGNDISKLTDRIYVGHIVTLVLTQALSIIVQPTQKTRLDKLKERELRKTLLLYFRHFGNIHPLRRDYLLDKLRKVKDSLVKKENIKLASDLIDSIIQAVAPSPVQKISSLLFGSIKALQNQHVTDNNIDSVSCRELLSDIVMLCKQFGFAKVFVLIEVDNVRGVPVDGNISDDAKAKKIYELISPLAMEEKLLGIDSLIFKFFLPAEVKKIYGRVLPLDKYGERTIEWREEDLRNLYEQRLSACWQSTKADSEETAKVHYGLAELCDDDLREIDEKMIKFAIRHGSPRALLVVGNKLIANHFPRSVRTKNELISRASWELACESAEEVLR